MKRILEEVARRKLLEEESRGQRWRRLLKEFVSTYYEKAKWLSHADTAIFLSQP